MNIRTVKYELEAKLKSIGGGLFSNPVGKLERKSYGDMTERLKISLRNLKDADGAEAVVIANGIEIARLIIEGGSAKYDKETKDPSEIPALKAGQTIQVQVDSKQVLTGDLYED